MNLDRDLTNFNKDQQLSFKLENDNNIDFVVDELALIYKIITIDDKFKLYNTYIESKLTRIIKLKKMTLTTQKLQKIHIDLWRLHDPLSLSSRNYITLLLDEYT